MITAIRTTSENTDFQKLVVELDAVLRILDGDEHVFYAQLNTSDSLDHILVMYHDAKPVGCGALRKYADSILEVKRMYVVPQHRGKGVASRILNELEQWAAELKYEKCILETGVKQVEAIALYRKAGYAVIENYGKYKDMKNSVCFEKGLRF